MEKTRIIFLRHAKSMANIENKVQGRGLDIPLSLEGEKQAIFIANKLKDIELTKIFTSTAKRSVDTALPIKRFHDSVPLEKIFELNERSKGSAEGMQKKDFDSMYPDVLKQWEGEIDVRVAGGENFEDVHNRAMPLIESHIFDYPLDSTLLYVIHGNVIKVLLGAMLGVPFALRARIIQGYCAYNSVLFDHQRRRWIIECVNKTLDDWR